MSVPGIVEAALDDEPVAAQVGLGGEDQLYVTPSRVLIYRGEGLLSDEAIEEYPHRADRVVVSEGRRKAKITLAHDLEDDRTFSVAASDLDDVLHPVLAGVLSTAGVTDAGETVKKTYRFSELTLIVTSKRLVKHIGNAVWDSDFEEYRFEDTTDLDFEEGSVATQIVMEVDGRRERIKAPNDAAPEVRATLEEALFDFYGVASVEEFRAQVAEAEDEATGAAPDPDADDGVAFESGLSPLSTNLDDDAGDAGDPLGGGGDVDAGDPLGADSGTADPEPADPDPVAGAGVGADDGVAAREDPAGGAGGTGGAGGPGDAGAEGHAGTAGGAGRDAGAAGRDAGAAGGDASQGGAGGEHQAADAFVEGGSDAGSGGGGGSAEDPLAGVGGTAETTAGAEAGRIDDAELAGRLDAIAESVNKQNELLKRHQRTMEKLIDELQRMNE